MHNSSDSHYTKAWDKILEEFATLENSTGMNSERMNRTKLLIRWAQYLQEQAMIKHLFFKTNAEYIRELRKRGYHMDGTSHEAYWESLSAASKRVHHHVTFMESLKIKIDGDKKDKKPEISNPFDQVMAWILSNGINADENISVKRYVEIKKIINNRIKSIESQKRKNGSIR